MKKQIILMTALLASSMLLAGCKNTESTVKSSELSSVSSEEPSSSSSEERGEDVWELVEEDAFVAAIAASQERSISYSRCEATGFMGEGQEFTFSNLEYLKNNKGKYAFILNYEKEEKTFKVKEKAYDLISEETVAGDIILPGYGVIVLKL